MQKVIPKTKNAVAHVETKPVLTPSDTKAILHALKQATADSSPRAPAVQKSTRESDAYRRARSKAINDRKFHP